MLGGKIRRLGQQKLCHCYQWRSDPKLWHFIVEQRKCCFCLLFVVSENAAFGHKQKHSWRRGGGVWFWRGSCRFISHVAIQPTAYSESARFLSVGQLWWLIHLAANCPVHSEKCRLDFITARCKGEYCIWRRFCIGISSCIWTLVNIWEKNKIYGKCTLFFFDDDDMKMYLWGVLFNHEFFLYLGVYH